MIYVIYDYCTYSPKNYVFRFSVYVSYSVCHFDCHILFSLGTSSTFYCSSYYSIDIPIKIITRHDIGREPCVSG